MTQVEHTDTFRSNNGTGPLLARVLFIDNGIATMERWRDGGRRITYFELPGSFLRSPLCGWVKQPSAAVIPEARKEG